MITPKFPLYVASLLSLWSLCFGFPSIRVVLRSPISLSSTSRSLQSAGPEVSVNLIPYLSCNNLIRILVAYGPRTFSAACSKASRVTSPLSSVGIRDANASNDLKIFYNRMDSIQKSFFIVVASRFATLQFFWLLSKYHNQTA